MLLKCEKVAKYEILLEYLSLTCFKELMLTQPTRPSKKPKFPPTKNAFIFIRNRNLNPFFEVNILFCFLLFSVHLGCHLEVQRNFFCNLRTLYHLPYLLGFTDPIHLLAKNLREADDLVDFFQEERKQLLQEIAMTKGAKRKKGPLSSFS